jgi:ferredoxin
MGHRTDLAAMCGRHDECLLTNRNPPDEAVRDAAASCPVEAISLGDADTGQPVVLD